MLFYFQLRLLWPSMKESGHVAMFSTWRLRKKKLFVFVHFIVNDYRYMANVFSVFFRRREGAQAMLHNHCLSKLPDYISTISGPWSSEKEVNRYSYLGDNVLPYIPFFGSFLGRPRFRDPRGHARLPWRPHVRASRRF